MKLVTSLLLGSAATLAAVAGAQAADLPFRKAAPVDYVRVCDWVSGGGYFYIPGTDTCLKIGGEARFEYAFVQPDRYFVSSPFTTLAGTLGTVTPSRARNASGFFARGKIEVDARTQTAYGLLRANVRLQGDRDGGNFAGPFAGVAANGNSGASVTLDRGYITFAGITAGRVQSFFDFYADNYNYDGIANSDSSTQALAYTATFGGGFSGTIAVEEASTRRDGIGAVAFNGLGGAAIGVGNNAAAGPLYGVGVNYGGERFPDAVLQLRYDQAWGAIQLSGAYHDINTISNGVVVAGTNQFATSTETGFAVQAGLDLKLPMFAAGDELWLQGAYQEGAFTYQDEAGILNGGYYGIIVGGFVHPTVDAVAVGNTGTNGYHLDKGRGFSVLGAFHHYFTPQFHDVLYGSYEELGYGNEVRNISWRAGGIGDASEFRVGNQFIFTPVHNLDLGVDVMYSHLDQDLGRDPGLTQAQTRAAFRAATGTNVNDDAFTVRLRLNRDF